VRLLFTKSFDREYGVLCRKNIKYKDKVNKTLSFLQFDLRHPSLRLHKLSTLGVYSVSVDMKIRILFAVDEDKLHLLHIGNRDEVY